MYVHAAPPCGTSSRARNRRIPLQLRLQGIPDPQPLRSDLHPLGLPGLDGVNKIKVEKANHIYEIVARTIIRCIDEGILFSVENPENSYMWSIPIWKEISEMPEAESVLWDACMHGGERDKGCKWLCSKDLLTDMGIRCDNQRKHAPWSITAVSGNWHFSTADEAQFPVAMCERVADLVEKNLYSRGVKQSAVTFDEECRGMDKKRLRGRAQVGKQPPGRKMKPLISEYASVQELSSPPEGAGHKVLRQLVKKMGFASGSVGFSAVHERSGSPFTIIRSWNLQVAE